MGGGPFLFWVPLPAVWWIPGALIFDFGVPPAIASGSGEIFSHTWWDPRGPSSERSGGPRSGVPLWGALTCTGSRSAHRGALPFLSGQIKRLPVGAPPPFDLLPRRWPPRPFTENNSEGVARFARARYKLSIASPGRRGSPVPQYPFRGGPAFRLFVCNPGPLPRRTERKVGTANS